MHYLLGALKRLPILLSILLIHTLVLGKILNNSAEKRIVPSPKPLMVSLITPEPILKAPPPIKPVSQPLVQKTILKKSPNKKVAKLKKRKNGKVKRKRVSKRKKLRKANTTEKSRKKNRLNRYKKSAALLQTVSPINAENHAEKPVTPQKTDTSFSQTSHSRQTIQSTKTSALISSKKKAGKTTAPSYQAAYLHNPPPAYPRISKRLGEEGTVLLWVKVSKNGKAALVQIKKSSGSKRLDNAAHQAVNKWRFAPAKKEGKVVSGWVIVPIVFQLR
jgi:protein TonB